jgi:hypothetical protein
MTAGKNLSKDQTETIYKENFSIASQELLSRFTKKQSERITELERQKMNQIRN